MNKQIAVAIMAILASVGVSGAATVAPVTPPPAIAKALASVHRQFCLMDAGSQGRMQHRLSILGIKTPVRTGVDWPLVMYYHRVCAPTKADLHLYEQAQQPIVKAVRDRFHAPVWNLDQAYKFCTKLEKRKGVKTTGIIGALYLCPAVK
ncbi:hypothetical protein GL267_003050 [Acidithiobacillus ferrianus]|uniref:Uncharacterized protein n=2 Tax=Acidithiobacillus ferrianus TaxID=2678518 RepID=A0A845UB05_9PROT|nr:hypothetical protein [Acidithiobacillus ferrianus]NDU43349.1 hypothetical protein [Acidithiobacillus ferrianus]